MISFDKHIQLLLLGIKFQFSLHFSASDVSTQRLLCLAGSSITLWEKTEKTDDFFSFLWKVNCHFFEMDSLERKEIVVSSWEIDSNLRSQGKKMHV